MNEETFNQPLALPMKDVPQDGGALLLQQSVPEELTVHLKSLVVRGNQSSNHIVFKDVHVVDPFRYWDHLKVDGHRSVEPYPEILPYATTPLFVIKGGVNEQISEVIAEVNNVMVIRLRQLVVQTHGLVMQNILLKLVPLSKHRMKTLSGMILTIQIHRCGTLDPTAHHTET